MTKRHIVKGAGMYSNKSFFPYLTRRATNVTASPIVDYLETMIRFRLYCFRSALPKSFWLCWMRPLELGELSDCRVPMRYSQIYPYLTAMYLSPRMVLSHNYVTKGPFIFDFVHSTVFYLIIAREDSLENSRTQVSNNWNEIWILLYAILPYTRSLKCLRIVPLYWCEHVVCVELR